MLYISMILKSILQAFFIFGTILVCNWVSLVFYNSLCYPSFWASIVTSASPLCNLFMYIHAYGTSLYSSSLYFLLTILLTKIGYHISKPI